MEHKGYSDTAEIGQRFQVTIHPDGRNENTYVLNMGDNQRRGELSQIAYIPDATAAADIFKAATELAKKSDATLGTIENALREQYRGMLS